MQTKQTGDIDILRTVVNWRGAGSPAAIAIVVATWGSAPRPSGSLMVVNADGSFVGSVSGGCVEGEVVTEALSLLRSGDVKVLDFIVSDDDARRTGSVCGGQLKVFIAPVVGDLLACLETLIERQTATLIINLSDGIMVARGDLGVEVPPEEVPALQKRIVFSCRSAGKPVVVATQMLESMIHSPTPTRAEASDVATAIYDGADAVMLSAETAVGDYPVEAVTMMDRIIQKVERDPHYSKMMNAFRYDPESTAADAITAAARQVAQTISASVIVTFSSTGSTTLRCARERPSVPLLSLTPRADTARKMSMAWGVHSVLTEDLKTFHDMVVKATRVAKTEGFGDVGDPLVITAGVPFGTPGATNILRIAWVD